MWVKIDDQLYGNPKVRRAWQTYEPALGLHLLSLSHAGCYLTNGFVDEAFVRMMLPSCSKRQKAVQSLVDAELWEEDPANDGYWIHDYLEYNDSREQVMARRSRDSARKRNGHGAES